MKPPNKLNDKLVWKNFQEGDEKAYGYLFDAYFNKLYQYGIRIHANPSLVKDCIQELFIKLWRTKEKLGQPVSVGAYLSESLKRILLKELARKNYKLTADLSDNYVFEVVVSHEWTLIDGQISAERLKQLQQALQKLTKRQRDAIHLKFYGNLSYEEIAEIMELNVRSVYNLISKALEKLYQELNQYDDVLTVFLLMVSESMMCCSMN